MLASPVSLSLGTSQVSFGNSTHVSLQQPVGRGIELSDRDITQQHFVVRLREFGDGLQRHLFQTDQNIQGLRAFFDVVVQGTSREEVHKTIKDALHKQEGYIARWFSNEGLEEWLSQETALGKVVKYFEDYVTSFTPMERFLERLDAQTIRKAEEEAQAVLEQLDQLPSDEDVVSEVDSVDPAYRFVATAPEHEESAWPFQGARADGKSFPEVSLGNVPDGAVMGFHLERCPTGWVEFNGIDSSEKPEDVLVDSVPIGSVVAFASNVSYPSDYLVCDGSELRQQDYPDLFAVIGGRYGTRTSEESVSFFHLPDFQGYFLRGWSNGTGTDPNAHDRGDRGDSHGGDVVGSVQLDATRRPHKAFILSQNGNHTHRVKKGGEHNHFNGDYKYLLKSDGDLTGDGHGDKTPGEPNIYRKGAIIAHEGHDHGLSESSSHAHVISEGGDDETRPINKNVVYLIKAKEVPRKLRHITDGLLYCEKQEGWSLNSPIVIATTLAAGVFTFLVSAHTIIGRVLGLNRRP